MREISLTNTKVEYALVDDADYDWLRQWNWQRNRDGYATRCQSLGTYGKSKMVFMHREILGIKRGQYTDHKNQNRLDNQRHNLRIVTIQQNNHNKTKQSNNTSGFIGVTYAGAKHGKPWKSYIYLDNHRLHLGQFDRPEEAAYTRDQVALQLFGEFANTNLELVGG